MAYTKNPTWQDGKAGGTLITAATLNHLEDGVEAAAATADTAQAGLAGKANTVHTHVAADVASGTLDIARVPTGTTGTTVALGNHTHIASQVGQVGPGPILVPGYNGLVPPMYTASSAIYPGGTSGASRLGGMRIGCSRDVTASAAAIEITTAAAGGTVRVGIYATGSNGWPSGLVVDSGSISAAATGVQSWSSSITLPRGDYWVLATASDTTIRFTGWRPSADLLGSAGFFDVAATVGYYFGISGDHPTGSPLPASLASATPTVSTEVGMGGIIVQLQVTAVS